MGRILGVVLLLVGCVACSRGTAPQAREVRSYLEGQITVSPEIDSSGNFSDFEVLVVQQREGKVDTLGYAVTDSSGRFAMDIVAPDRGVFPLLVIRYGKVLLQGEMVVAPGDSATLRVRLPHRLPVLPIRSRENAAWLAYRNLKASHGQDVLRALQDTTGARREVATVVERSARMLWNLQETYPGTVAAEVARAEAIAMVSGWNDSLAVAWARQIPPESAGYVEAARAAWPAMARWHGLDSALVLLETFRQKALEDEDAAALLAEEVRALADSLRIEEALARVRQIRREYPHTAWAEWADEAEYELTHLMPGQEAPTFTATTVDGKPFDLQALRGKYVVLEFWSPRVRQYERLLPQIQALLQRLEGQPLVWVSIALEPDREVYEAFAEGRTLPGLQILEESGPTGSLARMYAVRRVPMWYLLGPDGKILGKYQAEQWLALANDLTTLLQNP